MVLDGELKPGTQLLPDRELAKRFNVSRPTLREALYVLEASGVVEARLGGCVVELDAIVQAIREKWISGAALDVQEVEPMPSGHLLAGLDSVS